MAQIIIKIPRQVLVLLIRVYQKTISPDHGLLKFLFRYGVCRFTPTCSEYACDALTKHGVIKGGLKAFWRVLRCNPFSEGGYDPVNKPNHD